VRYFDISCALTAGLFEVVATGGDSALGGDDSTPRSRPGALAQSGQTSIRRRQAGIARCSARGEGKALVGRSRNARRARSRVGELGGARTRDEFDRSRRALVERTLTGVRKVLRDAKTTRPRSTA